MEFKSLCCDKRRICVKRTQTSEYDCYDFIFYININVFNKTKNKKCNNILINLYLVCFFFVDKILDVFHVNYYN